MISLTKKDPDRANVDLLVYFIPGQATENSSVRVTRSENDCFLPGGRETFPARRRNFCCCIRDPLR
jgi:hypothetical protein